MHTHTHMHTAAPRCNIARYSLDRVPCLTVWSPKALTYQLLRDNEALHGLDRPSAPAMLARQAISALLAAALSLVSVLAQQARELGLVQELGLELVQGPGPGLGLDPYLPLNRAWARRCPRTCATHLQARGRLTLRRTPGLPASGSALTRLTRRHRQCGPRRGW